MSAQWVAGTSAAWPSGLGKGLQSPVRGFDSRRRLAFHNHRIAVYIRAISSVGEHYLDTVGVTGSIPVSPTMEPPESGGSVVSRYTSMIICQRNVNRIEWHEVLRVTITGHVPAARAPPKSFTDTSATRGVPLLVALRAASPRPARPVTAHAARGVTRVYTLEINFAGRAVGFALGHSGEDCRQGWRRRTRKSARGAATTMAMAMADAVNAGVLHARPSSQTRRASTSRRPLRRPVSFNSKLRSMDRRPGGCARSG